MDTGRKDELQLTIEEGRQAFGVHVRFKAEELRKKYGSLIKFDQLQYILADEECIRYPTHLEFDSTFIDEGMFACVKKVGVVPEDGYIIFIHPYFQKNMDDVPALAFYHFVTINYGDFASCAEAEIFGSTCLGMEQDVYYQLLCRLTDELWSQK